MHWSAGIEAAVDDAVARATAGIPTVLDIEGQAGFGKTQLARTVAQRVPAGAVVRATAYEDTQSDPLGLLDQLGVETAGLPSNALSASRALGAHLDALAGDSPLVVVLDDLHWADPESLDAVGVSWSAWLATACSWSPPTAPTVHATRAGARGSRTSRPSSASWSTGSTTTRPWS